MKKFLFTLIAGATLSLSAQDSFVVNNVTIHTGTGQVINNGAVAVSGGKITYVGNQPAPGNGGAVIDGAGKHLYPGFIAPNSTLGLVEIESVRATRDQEETGEFNPNVRSIIAYNAESDVSATAITNGVLMAQITPRGGRISGTSTLVQLKAWNWEDAALKTDEGVHLNWPEPYQFTGWWAEPGGISKSKKYDESYKEMKAFFMEAAAYNKVAKPNLNDLRYSSMKGVFDGSKTLYVHATRVIQMREAIRFKNELQIPKMVFVGANDAHLIVDEIKSAGIPVIVDRVHSLPVLPEDPINQPYALAAKLVRGGLLVAINNEGDMEQAGVRNLPFMAGTCAAYGLTKEEALQTITLNPAKIMGIDKQLGSIEVGKDATFFISAGDALDMRTNQLSQAWIKGKSVSLENRQFELYQRYKKKYEEAKK